MMRYLLDTDICIYVIKKRPPEVIERFKQHSPGDIAVSTITLFELQYGVEKSRQRSRSSQALSRFLSPLGLLSLDSEGALEAAAIRAQLQKAGKPIGPYDLLIAGLARTKDMILVSNNSKEFGRIKDLKLENWVK